MSVYVYSVVCGLVPALSPEYCNPMSQCSVSPFSHAVARCFLRAVALALAGGIAAGLAVLLLHLTVGGNSESDAVGMALGGAMLAYPLGVIGGLLGLKRVLRIAGSVVLGIVGVIAGVALSLGIARLLSNGDDPSVSVVLYFVLVPVIAAVGIAVVDPKRRSNVEIVPPPDAD